MPSLSEREWLILSSVDQDWENDRLSYAAKGHKALAAMAKKNLLQLVWDQERRMMQIIITQKGEKAVRKWRKMQAARAVDAIEREWEPTNGA